MLWNSLRISPSFSDLVDSFLKADKIPSFQRHISSMWCFCAICLFSLCILSGVLSLFCSFVSIWFCLNFFSLSVKHLVTVVCVNKQTLFACFYLQRPNSFWNQRCKNFKQPYVRARSVWVIIKVTKCLSFHTICIWHLLLSTHRSQVPLWFLTAACQMTLCLFASTWRATCMSAIMHECVWSWPQLWQVDVVLRDPSHSLWSSPATGRGIHRVTSPFPPIHASPPGALTAAAARRGPLVKPCCHTPWHLPPYLRSKCQNHHRQMFDFYLFKWCFCPPLNRSWITFKIYCISKTQSRLPVYGSCQEAVMLVCSARHTHCLMNSWAWGWKKSL